jgi:type IV pilus assembly protein PilV
VVSVRGATIGKRSVKREVRADAEQGFTLIELLITLTVLAIGVLALASMMPAGSRSMNRSRNLTIGTSYAAQKIEDLKALTWGDSSLAAGTYSDRTGQYSRTWVITDNTPLTGVKKVTVTVTWPASNGMGSCVLNTYIGQIQN